MSVAANRYAKALIEVLYPDAAEAGQEQLIRFAALLREQEDMRRFFENPTIPAERRRSMLKEISDAAGFDKRVANFIDLLADRNRLNLFDEILRSYQKLLDEKLGVVRAVVTSAHPLDRTEHSQLAAQLEKVTGKQVRMEVAVDPALIGGVVAQVGSTIYDGSVRRQLQAFKTRLIQD